MANAFPPWADQGCSQRKCGPGNKPIGRIKVEVLGKKFDDLLGLIKKKKKIENKSKLSTMK